MRTAPKLPRPLTPPERLVEGPIWPDEYIEHWAAVYLEPQANRMLRARAVRFETFLRAPREILEATQRHRQHQEAQGLLPRQKRVRDRLDQDSAVERIAETALEYVAPESCCSNGRVVEKMRHHAHPKSRAAFQGGR